MTRMIKEYGGKESYKSKAAKKRHEAKESPAKERAEKKGFKPCRGCPSPAKCKKAGKCMKKK